MKILQKTGYTFAPASRTLDFAGLPGFDVRGLFAVISLTAGVPIYVIGADGLGFTNLNGSKVTLAADTSSMSANDSLLVLYDDGTLPASAPLQTAGNTILSSILTTLRAQIDFESSVWTDGTNYFVRRETLNEGTGAVTVSYTDPAGAAVTPPAGIRPAASDTAIQLLTSLFDVKTAGTGYSVGDQLSRIVAVNKATTPPTASSAIWLNMTTGSVIAAPAAASIAETDQNVTVTSLALGNPGDAVASSDSGSFSLLALAKRALGNWTTLLSRIPAPGQALKAASLPVTLASDQGAVLVAPTVPDAVDRSYGANPDAGDALPINAKRTSIYVYNNHSADIFINFRSPATALLLNAGNIRIAANGGDWRSPSGMCPKSAMSVITSSGSGAITIMEGTSP